ncbi:glycoside hydrolase family 70 protein, partial [Lactobacillus amylovorus]
SQGDLNAATQVIQKEIEMRITQTKSTKWLKAIIQEFIQDQSQYSLVKRDEKSNKLVDGQHKRFKVSDVERLNKIF